MDPSILNDYNALSEYAQLEGTELGDYCTSLLCIRDYNTDHGMTEEFNAAIDREISYQAENFKLYARIVEKTETPAPRTVKELEWFDE